MDQFQDGSHVHLRSRVYGTFLCADEDGRGVSLDPHRASLHAAWTVHLLVRDGVPYSLLLLRSMAYGRYLATSKEPAPMGLRGYLVEQLDYDHPDEFAIRWVPLPSASGNDVVLHNMYRRGHLRANSGYLNRAAVTIDTNDDVSAPMDWAVEIIPEGEIPSLGHRPQPPVKILGQLWPAQRQVPITRKIMIRAPGNFEPDEWRALLFTGRSLLNLTNKLINVVGAGCTISVQAGSLGRLTPLQIDLPRNSDTLHVVLLPSETQEVVNPSSNAKIVNSNGQISELGVGVSIVNSLVEHIEMPSSQKAGNKSSPDAYLWLVRNGEEAREAIRQWEQLGRPATACVDLLPDLTFSDMTNLLLELKRAKAIELAEQSADYAQWIRRYQALASICHLPRKPEEVAARFSTRSHQKCVQEPWVLVNNGCHDV